MKRLLFFLGLLLVTVTVTFSQQLADTIPIVHTIGQSALDFLKTNAWNIALIAFLLISELLGSTNKVKEGSIWAWIINMIGKIIRSKTDLVTTKKAMFMTENQYNAAKKSLKILVLALLLSGLGLAASAQGPFKGFFKPVKQSEYYSLTAKQAAGNTDLWLVRPAVNISSIKYTYNKDSKQTEVSPYVASGFGLGYQHYIDSDGVPFNNYGFNLLMLFNTIPLEDATSGAGLSVAGTFGFMKMIDIGGGYDFTLKKPFALTGIKYNF